MRNEVQAEDIELGQPLKSALVDEMGFPVADQCTIFQSAEEPPPPPGLWNSSGQFPDSVAR